MKADKRLLLFAIPNAIAAARSIHCLRNLLTLPRLADLGASTMNGCRGRVPLLLLRPGARLIVFRLVGRREIGNFLPCSSQIGLDEAAVANYNFEILRHDLVTAARRADVDDLAADVPFLVVHIIHADFASHDELW